MKVNFLRKAKWYIVAFILAAVMLSVSLSFCVWDTLSAKVSTTGKGGNFAIYGLKTDKNGNGIADVGDIVGFGKYYQQANTSTKTDIRWIVVNKDSTQLTLLAESVMAFGSFWGTRYHNGSKWEFAANNSCYQNYSMSTVRAWLNSNYSDRNDGGTAFSASAEPRFRGFLSEAFTAGEQSIINAKTISGIKGYGKDDNSDTPTESYATVTDKVWLPSWSEVYGTTRTTWGITQDGSPNTRFSYFEDASDAPANSIYVGKTTAFASSQYSNYTFTDAISKENYQKSPAGGIASWWLRSPYPSSHVGALLVGADGGGDSDYVYISGAGVRPAVCVQL